MTEAKPTAKAAKQENLFEVVAPFGVNVRKYDRQDSDIVRVVEHGEVITALSVGVDWVKVEDGYIRNRDFILKKK